MSGKPHPPPPPERKLIIGVPVLPGLPLQTEHIIRDTDADSIGSSTVEDGLISPFGTMMIPGVTPAAPAPSNGENTTSRWKLRHIDFIPQQVKGKKEDDFERFSTLMEKANEWSAANPQALVFSCESVQWMSMDRPIFTDSGVLNKSMNSDRKTRVMRGLRVWYLLLDDTFFDASDKAKCPGPFRISYANFTPEGKNDTFPNMLGRLNDGLFKKAMPGKKLLRVETIHQLKDCADPEICTWRESPENTRDYISFFRAFFFHRADDQTRCGEVGMRDFFPAYDQRTPHSQGYETFSDIWRKAARWVHLNPHINVVNFQSVYVRFKKGDSDQVTLFNRCHFKENGAAYGSVGHTKTDYIQILRVVYNHGPAPGSKPEAPVAKKMYYRPFTPTKIRRGLESAQGDDQEPLEYLYEDLRHLEGKINAWMTFSGAKIFGLESIPTRLMTGGQETVGTEATYAYNDREKNINREYWRVNLRVYIEGDFNEYAIQPTKGSTGGKS